MTRPRFTLARIFALGSFTLVSLFATLALSRGDQRGVGHGHQTDGTADFCAAARLPPGDCRAFVVHADMRKLWEDHIVWTRQVIVSVADDLPDLAFAVDRLLLNQVDIGDAIKPFYGDAVGNEFTELLTEHILIAADILFAAKAGDADATAAALDAWYVNGDDIATFLNRINPRFIPLDDMKDKMRRHLDTTLAEAVARLNADYAADVEAYDAVHDHILHMSDTIANGIIRQFRRRF